jgi:hypothetical protein
MAWKASNWHAGLVIVAAVLLAACESRPADEAGIRDPEGVLGDVALAEGDRVCETAAHGPLLVSGVVLAHADGNMHRVGECHQPARPLFAHEQQIDRPPAEQDLFVRIGDNRYLRVRPERPAAPATQGDPDPGP